VVAQALERYQATTGNYPDKLEALMPQYLPAIPELKPVLNPPQLRYALLQAGHPFLYYGPSPIAFPVPKSYNFETKVWETRD
jgi:hypothetical protein